MKCNNLSIALVQKHPSGHLFSLFPSQNKIATVAQQQVSGKWLERNVDFAGAFRQYVE